MFKNPLWICAQPKPTFVVSQAADEVENVVSGERKFRPDLQDGLYLKTVLQILSFCRKCIFENPF